MVSRNTAEKFNKDDDSHELSSNKTLNASSVSSMQKTKITPSWGAIIIWFIFFFPIGIFLLIKRISADEKLNLKIRKRVRLTLGDIRKWSDELNQEAKRKIAIGGVVLAVLVAAVGGICALVQNIQAQEEKARYSITVDGAVDNGITVGCNIIEGSRDCEKIRINGSYDNGERKERHLIVSEDDIGIELKGEGGFYLVYSTAMKDSSETSQEKSVVVCFASSKSSHYCDKEYPIYNLRMNILITDEDRQKVKMLEQEEARKKEEEARKKEEEEARKAIEDEQRLQEKNANERVGKLKSCQIPTSEWTDDESAAYWNEYISCSNKEYDNTKTDWENTAPSTFTTFELCKKALNMEYPYGVKIHYIAGVLVDAPESADTRLYKVQIDITNAFGQKRSTVAECKAQKVDNNMVKLIHFYVY